MAAKEETRKRVVQTLYWKELRRMLLDAGGIVDENGLNVIRIAAAAGTHPQTTRRLFNGTTLFPQYRTVWCNLAALGYGVQPIERGQRVESQIQKSAEAWRPKKKKSRKKKSRGGKK